MLLFAALLAGYILFRGILPMRIHRGCKVALFIPVLLTAFKFHLLFLFGGQMFFAPDLPGALLLAAAVLFAWLFLFFFLLLVSDFVRLALLLYFHCAGIVRTERFRVVGNRVNLGLLLLAGFFAGLGIFCGTSLPEIRNETVFLKNLPPEADGVTVAVLSDLHADGLTGAGRIAEIVKRTNAQNPDLIVIVGDFVDGRVAVRGGNLLPLKELSARIGVFGVPGNHEYYSGYEEWIPFLRTLGIRMLLNEHELLPCGIAVAGVTDSNGARFRQEPPDPGKALSGIPEDVFRILLSHRPGEARSASMSGVGLQLSGHTHGGLILGLDLLVGLFNGGFVAGFYEVGNMSLYVCRGTGIWSGFPVRLGVPSEITLLRLKRGER